MRAPEFWHHGDGGVAAALLSPLAAVYGAAAKLRGLGRTPWRAPVPVICVGNVTVGGTGKTPVVLALAERLKSWGLEVACLSRGYGGRLRGPVRVDPGRHGADAVGDEPLLLAQRAPTWVARDRKDGARLAIADGADVVLMDDGLQNPALRKDISLVVIDGGYGVGNGRVLPAGPLREPMARGLARTTAVVLVGDDRTGIVDRLPRGLPVLRARLEPDAQAQRLRGQRVFAFAGIGRPEKFFATLREIGAELAGMAAFADHHAYGEGEIARLLAEAQRLKALAVTTAKDLVRLPEAARAHVTAVGVSLRFAEPERLEALLQPVLRERHG